MLGRILSSFKIFENALFDTGCQKEGSYVFLPICLQMLQKNGNFFRNASGWS